MQLRGSGCCDCDTVLLNVSELIHSQVLRPCKCGFAGAGGAACAAGGPGAASEATAPARTRGRIPGGHDGAAATRGAHASYAHTIASDTVSTHKNAHASYAHTIASDTVFTHKNAHASYAHTIASDTVSAHKPGLEPWRGQMRHVKATVTRA